GRFENPYRIRIPRGVERERAGDERGRRQTIDARPEDARRIRRRAAARPRGELVPGGGVVLLRLLDESAGDDVAEDQVFLRQAGDRGARTHAGVAGDGRTAR